MSNRCCKTCAHFAVPLDQTGRRVVRSTNSYRCAAEVPNVVLPDSVTLHVSFNWPPPRSWMSPSDGTTCPTWQELPNKKAPA